jgi:radical SAM protein with 4Fe4S-binding SPASM domain
LISYFIDNRDLYFKKVVSRLYVCNNSIQLISYNLLNNTTTILEDESATLFDLMYKNSEQELLNFLINNQITVSEFYEFIEELLQAGSLNDLNGNTNTISTGTNTITDDSSEIRMFHETLFDSGYLYNLHLDITKKCNLHCIHCYHPFDEYKTKAELSLSEIKHIIDDAYDLGVFVVVISGGEPTLRPDFFDILSYISDKGMCIDLYTNAVLINKNFSEKLASFNIRKISISLYSSYEPTHDKITQHPGSCESTKNAIDDLILKGFNVELKTLLMKPDFDDYQLTCAYAHSRKCSYITDISMTPLLNSDKKTLSLSIDEKDYIQLCQDNLSPFKPVENIVKPEKAPCNAGRYSLYCDSDGSIYPCVSFRKALGTINSGLKAAWNSNELQEWQNVKNKDFYDFGKYSFCKYCPEICAGIAQLENNDFHICRKSDCYRAKAHELLLRKEVKT